jgi:hypothetical protein
MPILVLLASSARAACLDVPTELAATERSIVDVRLDDAGRSLERIEAAIEAPPGSVDGVCARLDPTVLARFWIAEGAMASLSGSADAATRAFRAAHRVDPTQWTTVFGSTLRAEWESAAQLADASGSVALDMAPPTGRSTWLDGIEATFPVHTTDGLHLVQLGTDDQAAWGTIVLVPAGETFVVRVPELPPLPMAPVEPVEATTATRPAPSHARRNAFLAGGAACLIAGGAFAIAAEGRDDDVADAGDVDELEAAHRSQQQLATVSYTLLGLGAAGVVVAFAW